MTVMSQIYQFGPFRLDAQRGELARGGAPVVVGGRALRVLAALLARPGELVTKDELMQAGWPGMFIEEGNIATQIRNLRHILGDEGAARQLIVTVPGRGYRFAGDVVQPAAAPAAQAAVPLPPQAAREELILGRERELATLHAAVTRHRLVTVTGAGGIGKTRLAAEFAAELSADATGRLVFLPLEDVRQEGQVASRLAALLGVAAGAEPERAVLAALRPRAHFLVFDNCEHLLAEMAALTEQILAAAPRVNILATSREALGVTGEFLLRLEPLALPDQHVPAALARDYPAIKLFEAAAQEAGAAFAVTAGNAAAVLNICQRLEGMPLALRLAGGRLAGGSLADLAFSLSGSWRLPAASGARLPARQRSMEATIAWSVALLTAAEREFFIRLGVFPTSFTAAAAAALAPSGVDAAATLAALAAKSLVVAVATAGPVPRYRLLEPLRDFALRQLTPAEERFCRMKLLDYFSDYCEQAKRDYRVMSTAEWLPRYGGDHETVEDLLQWAIFGPGAGLDGVAEAAIHLNYAASPLRVETRERVDIERWNQAMLALLTDDTPALLRAKTLAMLTTGLNEIGATRYAEQVREAAGIFRQLGERAALGMALSSLGAMLLRPDNIIEAENVTREAATHLRVAGEARHLATCIGTLAVCRSMAGDLPGAEEKLAECLRLAQQAGCQRIIREARAFQVGLAIEAVRPREAIRLAQAQIAVCHASGRLAVESYLLLKLSAAHLMCGDPKAALAAIGEATACYSGNYLAEFTTQAAAALAADGGAENACRLLGFAAARYRKMGIDFISSPFDETARRRVAEILGEAACARLRAEGALWDDEETIECLRTVAAGAGTGLGRPQK
jgi:predicted ATPase/DNA-binding winged helix-turn-helix (wHTH) protein